MTRNSTQKSTLSSIIQKFEPYIQHAAWYNPQLRNERNVNQRNESVKNKDFVIMPQLKPDERIFGLNLNYPAQQLSFDSHTHRVLCDIVSVYRFNWINRKNVSQSVLIFPRTDMVWKCVFPLEHWLPHWWSRLIQGKFLFQEVDFLFILVWAFHNSTAFEFVAFVWVLF